MFADFDHSCGKQENTDPQLFPGFHIANGSHSHTGFNMSRGSQIFCVVYSKLGSHTRDGFSSVTGYRFA
jgi:hypothetical protein